MPIVQLKTTFFGRGVPLGDLVDLARGHADSCR